jgi:hypothetical protein
LKGLVLDGRVGRRGDKAQEWKTDRDSSPLGPRRDPREDRKLRRGSAVCFGLNTRQAVRICCWSKALKATKAGAVLLDALRWCLTARLYRLGAEEQRQEGNPGGDKPLGPDSGA